MGGSRDGYNGTAGALNGCSQEGSALNKQLGVREAGITVALNLLEETLMTTDREAASTVDRKVPNKPPTVPMESRNLSSNEC